MYWIPWSCTKSTQSTMTVASPVVGVVRQADPG